MMKQIWGKFGREIEMPFYDTYGGLSAHIYKRDKIQTWVRADGSIWRLFKYDRTISLT